MEGYRDGLAGFAWIVGVFDLGVRVGTCDLVVVERKLGLGLLQYSFGLPVYVWWVWWRVGV